MIDNKRIIAIVPARAGSKGLPGKNIKMLCGKPLMAWSIEAGLQSNYIDEVMVTTDNQEIADIAKQYGAKVPFLRPKHLAKDNASMVDTIIDVLTKISGFEYAVILQPTSPLRTVVDVDNAFELLTRTTSPSCISVSATDKPPHWMYYLVGEHRLQSVLQEKDFVCRQDIPATYSLNGAICIFHIEFFLKTRKFITEHTCAYIMQRQHSVDIDTIDDFDYAAYLLGLERK